jgi:hypothetical protein
MNTLAYLASSSVMKGKSFITLTPGFEGKQKNSFKLKPFSILWFIKDDSEVIEHRIIA